MSSPTWGIVATIKAPTDEVLKFAAYHLDLGADDVTIFLDDCNEETATYLNAHPKTRAILTDKAYWQNTLGRRPGKHQVRQMRNASYHYREAKALDWIAHIDVDEFICADRPITQFLEQCPAEMPSLRLSPCESLCTDDQPDLDPAVTYCKSRLPSGAAGQKLEQVFYPDFGGVLKNGFVSHLAGKIFVRTGYPDVKFGIHRAFANQTNKLQDLHLPGIELCHRHIESWDKWLSIMAFRLEKGSYRAELEQSLDPLSGRIQRHKLFTSLTEGGTDSLRAFFEEVCLATPRLRTALAQQGCLREFKLDLDRKMQKHFPAFS